MTRDPKRAAAPALRRGPGRPPNSDSEATKLRILDAAIESFGVGGFSATSSQTIARAAGVSAPTMYHHFVNKRQLYVAAFQHSVDIAWREYGEAAESAGGSLLDELMAVVEAAVGVMRRRPAMTMLAIRAAIDLGRGELDRTVPDGVSAAMARRAVTRGELTVHDMVYIRPLVEMVLWGVSVLGARGDVNWQQRCVTAIDLVVHGRLVQRPARRRRTG
jgi:AcrR family transcriptional regulator